MIYFYLWVLFLLSISLAVPIVAFVEKSRARKAREERATPAAEDGDQEADLDDAPLEEAAVDDGMGEFGEAVPANPDDFSAFEDFK